MKISSLFSYLASRTIYRAVPVYNLNWLKSPGYFQRLLGEFEITVVDVGARGMSVGELSPLKQHINYIGFDADRNEIERLNSQSTSFKSAKFIASYVGSEKKSILFGLHFEAGNSSIHPYSAKYNRWFRNGKSDYLDKWVKLSSDTLDALIGDDVDLIKLDTQGTECEILTGATRCLDSVLLVEAEVEFFEMYKGQKMAHDVIQMMYSKGFDLLYLNRVYAQSYRFNGEARGQLLFGDALFGLSRERAIALSTTKKVRYLALLLAYGHLDFAYDIYESSDDLQKTCPKIGAMFQSLNQRSILRIIVKSIIDKAAFLLLVARKTNGLKWDSDRSWPTR